MGGFDTEDGTDGAVAEAAPAPPPLLPPDPMDPRRFGARHAILAFALLLFAQLGMGFLVTIIAVIWMALRGEDIARIMPGTLDKLMLPVLIASAIGSVAATLLSVRLWAWHLVRDRSPSGLGLFVPRRRDLWICIAAGFALGAIYILATHYLPTSFRGGPVAKMAASNDAGRAVWAVLAVLIAPPIEELLFRGLMLRGMIASWGVTAASIVVTVLFFGLHLFEAGGYWPAVVAILVLSVVTLAARLRTGSVVASMAVHGAYNTALTVTVYAAATLSR